jgi:hypothetical protein
MAEISENYDSRSTFPVEVLSPHQSFIWHADKTLRMQEGFVKP